MLILSGGQIFYPPLANKNSQERVPSFREELFQEVGAGLCIPKQGLKERAVILPAQKS